MSLHRVFMIGHGTHSTASSDRPEFRKATKNMIWVQTALEAALNGRRDVIGENLGLVLGSSHGELDVTMNFLKTLAQTGMARPILFQNSLHNSTSGFAGLNLRITGPLLTVSDLSFTGEDALSSAMTFLRSGLCDHCLVAGVEAKVPPLETSSEKTSHVEWSEGAGALLLCSEEGLRRSGGPAIAELISIDCHRESGEKIPISGYYESNAIEKLAREISSMEPGPLRLMKPSGAWSEITWRLC